jgi:hypothetical protein
MYRPNGQLCAKSPAAGASRSTPSRLARFACLLVLLALLPSAAWADDWVPDRRRDYYDRLPNEYLIIPAVASLPGFGVFVGVLASGSNLFNTGMNVGAGLAESISGSDIHLAVAAFQEIPIWKHTLSFDYQYGDIKLGNYQAYVPGRNSPNFTYPVTQEFLFQLVRPTLRFWERRITLSYTLSFENGFNVDSNGNQISSRNHGASADLALDFTDDVVSPTRGVRFDYQRSLTAPTSSFFGTDSGNSGSLLGSSRANLTNEQYTFTGYLPVASRWVLVGDTVFFQALGDAGPGVVSGGSLPLRGYPGNRWSDRYGIFGAFEARYTIPLNRDLEIPGLAHGIIEGLQLAGFYEQGQVSPNKDNSLFTSMHSDYGAGVRVLLQAIVVRFDVAISDEGPQTALTVNEPF